MSDFVGSDVATMITQAVIVIIGNLYERFFGKIAQVPIALGSFLIVPTSMGVNGVTKIIQDSSNSVSFVLSMFVTFISMAVGGFFANTFFHSKRVF